MQTEPPSPEGSPEEEGSESPKEKHSHSKKRKKEKKDKKEKKHKKHKKEKKEHHRGKQSVASDEEPAIHAIQAPVVLEAVAIPTNPIPREADDGPPPLEEEWSEEIFQEQLGTTIENLTEVTAIIKEEEKIKKDMRNAEDREVENVLESMLSRAKMQSKPKATRPSIVDGPSSDRESDGEDSPPLPGGVRKPKVEITVVGSQSDIVLPGLSSTTRLPIDVYHDEDRMMGTRVSLNTKLKMKQNLLDEKTTVLDTEVTQETVDGLDLDTEKVSADFPKYARETYVMQRQKYLVTKASKDKLGIDSLGASQRRAYDKCMRGENVFICGPAGTGKSYLLKKLIQSLRMKGLYVSVTCPTGIAASNLGNQATTIHSWSGAGLCNGTLDDDIRKAQRSKNRKNWTLTEVLIIDEVSMLDPELLDKVNGMAKIIRKNPMSFGGMQIILSGDWAQLEPIKGKVFLGPRAQYEHMTFCFETESWRDVIHEENVVILQENFRQSTDVEFQQLLSNIRHGNLSLHEKELLRGLVGAELAMPAGISCTTLLPHKDQVVLHNQRMLALLPGPEFKFKWTSENHRVSKKEETDLLIALMKTIPVQEIITLKKHAMVILTVNLDIESGLVNGLQGIVDSFDPKDNHPYVRFVNGRLLKMIPYRWKQPSERCKDLIREAKQAGKKISEDAFFGVSIAQVPLLVAFALTIHKSQSLTLEFVCIDLGPKIFTPGQAYTAISRARTLKGITLLNFDPSSIRANAKVIEYYSRYENSNSGRTYGSGSASGSIEMNQHEGSLVKVSYRSQIRPDDDEPNYDDDDTSAVAAVCVAQTLDEEHDAEHMRISMNYIADTINLDDDEEPAVLSSNMLESLYPGVPESVLELLRLGQKKQGNSVAEELLKKARQETWGIAAVDPKQLTEEDRIRLEKEAKVQESILRARAATVDNRYTRY